MRFRILLLFLLAPLSCTSLAAWEDYVNKSLRSTVDDQAGFSMSSDLAYTPGIPQRALVAYTGQKRAISGSHAEVLRGWIQLAGYPSQTVDLFQSEIQFQEEGIAYWMPVQETLISSFETLISPGDQVWLYVVWIGESKSDLIFIVNAFERITP